jgi:hypothetical protein
MTEQALQAALTALWRTADPIPAAVRDSALDAYAWRTVDQDLARLSAELDSDTSLEHVRGTAARTLTFEAGPNVVDIQAGRDGRQRRLFGQLDPPGPAEITVESQAGSSATVADDRGRFMVTQLAEPGWIRVSIALPDGSGFTTEWFYL